MLKVQRKHSDVDVNAPYTVYLNNMELCKLNDNEIKDFNLKSGKYKLKVLGGGFHSKELEFELSDGQLLQIACYPAYKNSKLNKMFYKHILNNEAIYIEIDKDIYL